MNNSKCLEKMLLEGLASGPSEQMSQVGWEALRAEFKSKAKDSNLFKNSLYVMKQDRVY